MRPAWSLCFLALTLSACAPAMRSFSLPYNATPPAPATEFEPATAGLWGVWSGTWLTPGWGAGYDALLIVEQIDHAEATVLYAYANPAGKDQGWYRQRAQVLPGPGLAWRRGGWSFTFRLSPDGIALAGSTAQATPPDRAFIRMKRTPFQAALPSRSPAFAVLPRLPAAAAIAIPPGTPPEQARFLGIWEGVWDSGIAGRLVVRGIAQGKAAIVYQWSRDPQGETVHGFRRLADVNEPAGTLGWGRAPRLTFRLSPDGQTLVGEWEEQGSVSLVTMRKVSPS